MRTDAITIELDTAFRKSNGHSPPPPEGFFSPMTKGVESSVIERFGDVPKKLADRIDFKIAGHELDCRLCVQRDICDAICKAGHHVPFWRTIDH